MAPHCLIYRVNVLSHTLLMLFPSYSVRYHGDFPVREVVASREAPEGRREFLLNLLGIDLDWRLHQLSDGETRRVQILLGLLQPFEVLLIDEITVDLDVLMRLELLEFLKRGALFPSPPHSCRMREWRDGGLRHAHLRWP
jgi:ABC-type multidrug transport system ATPase subunit